MKPQTKKTILREFLIFLIFVPLPIRLIYLYDLWQFITDRYTILLPTSSSLFAFFGMLYPIYFIIRSIVKFIQGIRHTEKALAARQIVYIVLFAFIAWPTTSVVSS